MRLEVARNADKVMGALENSPAGVSLSSTYRWKFFRSSESDTDWRDILGATAIDFSHGVLMFRIGDDFLQRERNRFTQEQKDTLLYGLLVHDFGEAIIGGEGVGDVSTQVKTKSDYVEEVDMAWKVIYSLDIDHELAVDLIYSYQQVVMGGDPKLHHAFKALERLEYVMTALKTYQNCRRRETRGETGVELEQAMVGRVLLFDLAKVIDIYAGEYPDTIGLYLHNMEPMIDEAYAYCKPWLMNNGWRDTASHAELCARFEKKWQAYKDLKA